MAGAGEPTLRESGVRLTEAQIAALETALDDLPAVEEEIGALAEEGASVLCPFDDHYPPLLGDLPSPPPVLCLRGDYRDADLLAVAIVGTRSPTPEGTRLAGELAGALAREGVTVVSGLARGVDTAAHRGALDAGGRTIAVLGCGIRLVHPAENAALAEEIAGRGALISELSPRARPSVRTLMARNRLQSALSKAVVVVESGEQGGSLQTAEDARRQGRLVYAADWPAAKPTAAGTRALLAKGALPLTGPADIPVLLERVRGHTPQPPARKPRPATGQLPLF